MGRACTPESCSATTRCPHLAPPLPRGSGGEHWRVLRLTSGLRAGKKRQIGHQRWRQGRGCGLQACPALLPQDLGGIRVRQGGLVESPFQGTAQGRDLPPDVLDSA